MITSRCLFAVLLAVVSWLTPQHASAAELALQAGAENFRWREFNEGSRLLEESGPRARFGLQWRDALEHDPRVALELRGMGYFGRMDYDGLACTLAGSCTPFQTNAQYTGLAAEGLMLLSGNSGGIIFGGAGADAWRRHIRGDAGVSGATEDWVITYLLAGAGARWFDDSRRYDARLGAKYPIYAAEFPDAGDVTLHPKGELSYFARFAVDFMSAGRPQWGLGVYYDGYRFGASDKKRFQSNDTPPQTIVIFQPESRQDVIGVYALIYLH